MWYTGRGYRRDEPAFFWRAFLSRFDGWFSAAPVTPAVGRHSSGGIIDG